jgi:rubrerythrin
MRCPVGRGKFTVYKCDGCGVRAIGEQRCEICGTFMRKVGPGGQCPHCDEPVTVSELLGQEVPA